MTDSAVFDEVSGEGGDRVTIGPSSANRDVLEALVREGQFKTALGAFQAAALFAVRKGIDPSTAPVSAGTMWNRGSVNKQVLEFLEWYLPTTTPTRALEQLGNAGTAAIAERVRVGGYDLSEIFEFPTLNEE